METYDNCYSVKVLADSISENCNRLTTFEATYPRFVHSELLTHRVLSKNSASSRAIPSEKMRKIVTETPALPIWWGKNQSGMQAREEVDDKIKVWEQASENEPGETDREAVKRLWMEARDTMVEYSDRLATLGLHKQLCNRLTEVWMPITIVVSATEWNNFFTLRTHPDAQPEIQKIAIMMKGALDSSTPKLIKKGNYHRPFIQQQDIDEVSHLNEDEKSIILNKVSFGRCARVSYLTHNNKRDITEDVKLCDRLLESRHLSPFEHVAQPAESQFYGNFFGWKQYRKEILNENGKSHFVV